MLRRQAGRIMFTSVTWVKTKVTLEGNRLYMISCGTRTAHYLDDIFSNVHFPVRNTVAQSGKRAPFAL